MGQKIVADTSPGSETKEKKDNRLHVQKTLSVDQIYEKVKDYDLVFTAEASLKDALNTRLEEPILGHFATTPMIYVLSNYQNQELLQERGLFHKVIENTELSWKQASYILENILDCWREQGAPDSILDYNRFDNEPVRKVLTTIENTDNIYKKMQKFKVDEEKDVAVVNFHHFNEIDKQVLPEVFDEFSVFTEQKKDLPEFKVYNSITEIIRAVQQNITKDNAQDVAIVNDRDGQYATLIESALQSKGIPMMVQEGLSEDEDLRTFIRLLRLGLSQERLLVKDCQPVLKRLGKTVSIELDNGYLQDVEDESLDDFKALLDSIEGSKLKKIIEEFERRTDSNIGKDLEELGILAETISEDVVNRLEYYLDTYDISTDSNGHGLLLAGAKSSAYVDRPIVFYLGMDSSWTSTTSDKPWVDKDSREETNLKEFKTLIQNGGQQHFLVQDRLMNEDVTPCLYFNELTDEEFESFRDLEHTRYQTSLGQVSEGFEKQEYSIEVEKVDLLSQSSLNSFVQSPKDYLFDKVTDSPDQDYFRKGTMFHDFAEFYINHTDFVKEHGREKFVELMVEEMKSIVDDLQLDLLQTEFKVGIKNIINFVETQEFEAPGELKGYEQKEKDNFFADHFNKDLEKKITESWFQNPDLGVKGIADLIISRNQIADYKSGKRKTASKIIRNSNLELLEDSTNFQAMLYLAQLRTANSEDKLQFTFFHFLDNIDDEMMGQAELEDNIVTITYYPHTFDEHAKTEEMFEYIMQKNHSTEKVAESNDRRKTLEVRMGYEHYREFFAGREIAEQYDKDKMQESQLADEFISYCKEKVGDYAYVEKGCKAALKKLVDCRKENYFKEDLDSFEEFMQKQIIHLNQFKQDGFPLQNPELEVEIDTEDLENRDMIPR